MFHFTDMQMLLLLIGEVTFGLLSFWALAVVIPARNETIERLTMRNQTLEYWVRDAHKTPTSVEEFRKPGESFPTGSMSIYQYAEDLEKRHINLLRKYNDVTKDNQFLKSVIAGDKDVLTKKITPDEQQQSEA